jgi:methylated-DNA-[protein]-cysteine S-methyltransferase
MQQLDADCVTTPIGDVVLVVDDEALVYLDFAENTARLQRLLSRRYGDFQLAYQANLERFSMKLDGYFAGELAGLNDLPVSVGGTPFQQRVWLALREIPVGQTLSYGELAEKVGVPTGARAVGRTNGLNPIGIVLPCHRVVGVNHTLTGYAGGIERKCWLLRHEGARFKDNMDGH